MQNHKKAFTLIELLVVISIISLLASIVLTSLSQARTKALDSKRVQDMLQAQKALELYYAKYGVYPPPTANPVGWSTNCWECNNTAPGLRDLSKLHNSTAWPAPNPEPDISEFLKTSPSDPAVPTGGIWGDSLSGYWYKSDCKDYKLVLVDHFDPKNIPTTLLDDGSVSRPYFVLNTGGPVINTMSVYSSDRSKAWQAGTFITNPGQVCAP